MRWWYQGSWRRWIAFALIVGGGFLGCQRSEGRRVARDLTSRDPAVREAAVHRLVDTEGVAARPTLERLLGDRSARVRAAAATALGRLRSRSSAKALGRLVRDPDPRVRLAAVRALLRLGHAQVAGYLLPAVADPNRQVRRLARNGLVDLGIPPQEQARRLGAERLRTLLKLLADPLPSRRAEAARSLGRSGRDSVVAPLERLLGDRYAVVADAAAEALGTVASPAAVAALERLAAQGAAARPRWRLGVRALLEVCTPAAAPVARRLLDQADAGLRRRALACWLALHPDAGGPEMAQTACGVLRADAPPMVRIDLAKRLRRAGVVCPLPSAGPLAPRLAALLTRPAGGCPRDLRRALGQRLGDPASVNPLVLVAALHTRVPELTRLAAAAVRQRYEAWLRGSERWLDEAAWRRLARDVASRAGASGQPRRRSSGSPRLRGGPGIGAARRARLDLRARKLAQLLARFPRQEPRGLRELLPPRVTPGPVKALVERLGRPAEAWLVTVANSAPSPVREAALRALARKGCGGASCRDAVRRALEHGDKASRSAVLEGLARRRGTERAAPIQPAPVPGWLVEALIRRVRDPDPWVRGAVRRALGRSRAPQAFAVLERLFRKGRDVDVVAAFGLLGDSRAVPLLLGLLREEQGPTRTAFRVAVIQALARLGRPGGRAVLRLREALEHPEPTVRLAAAQALARVGDGRALGALAVCEEDFYAVVRRACRQAAAAIRRRSGDSASARRRAGRPAAAIRRRSGDSASARRRAGRPATVPPRSRRETMKPRGTGP